MTQVLIGGATINISHKTLLAALTEYFEAHMPGALAGGNFINSIDQKVNSYGSENEYTVTINPGEIK